MSREMNLKLGESIVCQVSEVQREPGRELFLIQFGYTLLADLPNVARAVVPMHRRTALD
jgi:hypothetical protein